MENSRGRTNSLIPFEPDRLSKTFEDKLARAYTFTNESDSANYAKSQNSSNAQQ